MAKHIDNWKDRVKQPVDKYAWNNLLIGACAGVYNGQQLALKNITPLLYYSYVLDGFYVSPGMDVTYDIDHIIPQSLLVGNSSVEPTFKDCLLNLAMLPKKDNISKNDKPLNEITNPWLKQQIEHFEHIQIDEFEKFSTLANIEEFKEKRNQMYQDIFGSKRDVELSK